MKFPRDGELTQAVAMMALVVALLGNLLVWQLAKREQETSAQLGVQSCLGVEDLKLAHRETLTEEYNNLARNAKLLDVKLTPALRRRAKEDYLANLRRYAERPC